MSIEQVVQAFNIMRWLERNHERLRLEKVYPFLGRTIILQEILPDETIPTPALVIIHTLVKRVLFGNATWQVLLKELREHGFIFFVACVAVFNIPTIQLQGKIRKLGYQ